MARTRGSSERHRRRRRGHRRLRGRLRAGAPRRIGSDRRRSAGGHGRDAGVGRRAGAVHRGARGPVRCSSSPFAASISSTSSSRASPRVSGCRSPTAAPARSTSRSTQTICDASRPRAPTLAAQGRARASCSMRAGARSEEPHLSEAVVGGLLDAVARIRRGRRADARARGRGAPPRRPAHRARARPAHRQRRRRSASSRPIAGRCRATASCSRPAAGPGRLTSRACDVAAARPAGPRPAPAARVDRADARTRHLGRALLPRAVGRRHAARRRDGRGGRLRRADDDGGSARPDRSRRASSCRTRGPPGSSRARAGLRPATPDELPVIGPSTVVPNLVYATGHYRNGVLLAPLTAQLVADAMLDKQDRSAPRGHQSQAVRDC